MSTFLRTHHEVPTESEYTDAPMFYMFKNKGVICLPKGVPILLIKQVHRRGGGGRNIVHFRPRFLCTLSTSRILRASKSSVPFQFLITISHLQIGG